MDAIQLARSPGPGRDGRRTRARTNFFEVLNFPKGIIYHYDVTITPEVPPRLNIKVFNKFVEDNRDYDLVRTRPVYDGRKNMFVNKLLYHERSYDVILPEDRGTVAARRAPPRNFELKLKKVGEINMADLDNFINANGRRTENCTTAIMFLDVLVSYKTSITYPFVRKSFYIPPRRTYSIYGGLEAWRGYYQSVRPTSGKMMVNVNLTATAFYQAGPLIEVVTEILGKRSPDDLRRGILERERVIVERILKGVQIRDNHRGEKRRKFKIIRFTDTPASRTQFDRSDGGVTTVADYFRDNYRRLNFDLPCVTVKGNNFLPMEVCEVIQGQRYIRKLDVRQTSDMIKFACVRPSTRANEILDGVRDIINYRNDENLLQSEMRISEEMAVVNARVLEAPLLQYHPSSRGASFTPREGKWDLREKRVATGATLGSWSVLAFENERDLPTEVINAFIRELISVCQQTGLNIPNRNPPIQHVGIHSTTEESLKRVWLHAGNTAKAQPQLIICILPNTGKPLYAEIKRICDTVIGVASQCMQSTHVNNFARRNKSIKQYCANICLKMNTKLGGMNSFINPANIPFITERPTILIGVDVTHPKPGSSGSSVAALCASMDAKACRYSASIRIQESRVEIIADLANMAKELLKTFYQTCGRKPERVLFYRDGVSESQFEQVVTAEINAVRAACRALEANYKPTITFVVVQKRHHTRFFPIQETDKSGNCVPGTVVDTDITHPFEFDFYLQSHAGIQGTSRPAHYHVLVDENGFSSDGLQSLSYKLCYLYARCTRSVSLVPPIYYANLICIRARYHSSNWNESESSEGTAESASTFGVVKSELQRVMYFV